MPDDFESIQITTLINAIFYATPVGLALFGENVDKVYANQTFCEIFGYECEMLQKDMEAVAMLPAQIVADIRARYPFLNEREQPAAPQRHAATKRSGEPLVVRVTTAPFETNGRRFTVYTLSDITELEQLRQHNADARRVVRHDLRNYIASMGAAAEMLAEACAHDNADLRHEMLEYIRQTVLDATDLMENAQQAMLIEEQAYTITKTRLDLTQSLDSAVRTVAELARKRDIHIHITPCLDTADEQTGLCAEAPLLVNGERTLLTRMFINLLKNAVEAAPAGGAVHVTLKRNAEAVTVRMTNPGAVDPVLRERVFEKYATSKDQGVGLGCYIARRIAELHGGTLALDERPGHVAMTVTLPKAP